MKEKKRLIRTSKITKKIVLGLMITSISFGTSIITFNYLGTDIAEATDSKNVIGSTTNPKKMQLNSSYTNNYSLTNLTLEDYYYFETDDNAIDNEYTFSIINYSNNAEAVVNIFDKGDQLYYAYGNFDNFVNVNKKDGTITKTYNLLDNKKYYIRVKGYENVNYKISVTHRAATFEPIVKKVNNKWVFYNKNGKKDTSYTGVAKTTNGNWVFIRCGIYDSTYTGVAKSTTGNWVFVKNGRYYPKYTGVARSITGNWVYVIKGRFNKKAQSTSGVTKSTTGNNVYVRNGRFYTKFTGLAKSLRTGDICYVINGRFAPKYNGTAYYNGRYYSVRNGKAVM